MKMNLKIIFWGLWMQSVVWCALGTSPDVDQAAHLNDPIKLFPGLYLGATPWCEFYFQGPVGKGVLFFAHDGRITSKPFLKQLDQVRKGCPFPLDQALLTRVQHSFSKPFVKRVGFLKWTFNGKDLNEEVGNPDMVISEFFKSADLFWSIKFSVDFKKSQGRDSFLVFSRNDGVDWRLPQEELQEVLDHMTGTQMPKWLVTQIHRKLNFPSSLSWFEVRVPKLGEDLESEEKNYFRYKMPPGAQVREFFDAPKGTTTQYISEEDGSVRAEISDMLGGGIEIALQLGSQGARQSIEFAVRATGEKLVEMTDSKIQEVLSQLTGIPISSRDAHNFGLHLATHQPKHKLVVQIPMDPDLRIMQLLSTQQASVIKN